jgi:hypothetical protein
MSNMRNFHGLRRRKAMGKTARHSPTRSRSALGMEYPAILPWLLFFRWLCGGIPPRLRRAKPNCPRGID